jgi:hypothetical protein
MKFKLNTTQLTKFNLFLGAIFAIYVLCASKYIGKTDSLFYSNFYKLLLLIGVLVIYPYHKQAGITLLIIVMVTHLPMFREKFENFIDSLPSPTPYITTSNTPEPTSSITLSPNILENQESNYDLSIKKRQSVESKIKKEQTRFESLKQDNIITPLEQNIISDIQRHFDDQIDIITTDDFEKISKYTDEGDPINAGLLPKIINKSDIDYDQLILAGKVIDF